MTLEKMLSELQYRSNIEQAVRRKINKDEKLIKEIAETAYHGQDFHYALCKRMPLTRLAVITYLLLHKYDEYKSKGTSDCIIFDTFRDVSVRASLYCDKTGKAGISKDDVIWFRHIMNVNIFKIGTLQFQPFEMLYLDEETIGEPYMVFAEEEKVALPKGTPVLNCHIQHGADLSPQSVAESFQNAKSFFITCFPAVQYRAFLCYSWLLYPPMLKQLPEESNIKQFSTNFSIIGFCNDPEQATEALFGSETSRSNRLPINATSLQKLAFEHLELFGFACGIIPL